MSSLQNISLIQVKSEPIEILDDDDDDDDIGEDDLESLRLAALQTLRPKMVPQNTLPTVQMLPILTSTAGPIVIQPPTASIVPVLRPGASNVAPVSQQRVPLVRPTTFGAPMRPPVSEFRTACPFTMRPLKQTFRPPMVPRMPPSFRRNNYNSNLISIVPMNSEEAGETESSYMNPQQPNIITRNKNVSENPDNSLQLPQNRYCNVSTGSSSEEAAKVPSKFSRIDASDSESEDELLLEHKSSDEDDENEVSKNENNLGKADTLLPNNVTLQNEVDSPNELASLSKSADAAPEDEDDSLEKLMEEMEQELDKDNLKESTLYKDNLGDSSPKVLVKSLNKLMDVVIKKEPVDYNETADNKLPQQEAGDIDKNPIVIKKEITNPEYEKQSNFNTPILGPELKQINCANTTEKITASMENKKILPVKPTSSIAPLRIITPNELNLKFLKPQVTNSTDCSESSLISDVNKSIMNDSNLFNFVESSPSVANESEEIILPTAAMKVISPVKVSSFEGSSEGAAVKFRISPPKNHGIISPKRPSSPRIGGRYFPPRSLSPREYIPRRSVSPRLSPRSPIPYSRSPSPRRSRRRSKSRSPLRRRSRSWSRSYSRSYSRSRSRSRSPYWLPMPSSSISPERKYLRGRSPYKKIVLSSISRGYSPIKRFRDEKKDRLSISPRRSRSPYYRSPSFRPCSPPPYRSDSPIYSPLSPSYRPCSPSYRTRNQSLSPRRKLSPFRSSRAVSPKRSPSPYYIKRQRGFSPKRLSPDRKRISASPRKVLSPTRPHLNKVSISPERMRSPSRRELRNSRSPNGRFYFRKQSPISHLNKSLSPKPRRKSMSPVTKLPSRIGEDDPKHYRYTSSDWKDKNSDSRRKSPVKQLTSWNRNNRRRSLSPEKAMDNRNVIPFSLENKDKIQPKEDNEFIRKDVSARSQRCSPIRNLINKTSFAPRDNWRPQHYRNRQRERYPAKRSRSRSPELSTKKIITSSRDQISEKDSSNIGKIDTTSQDRFRPYRHRRNDIDRHEAEKERSSYRGRYNKDRDENRNRDEKNKDDKSNDDRSRNDSRSFGRDRKTTKEIDEKDQKQVEEKKIENVNDKKIIEDPVMEARRRKFESNSLVQPINKKIQLKTKLPKDDTNEKSTCKRKSQPQTSESKPSPPKRNKRVLIDEPDSNSQLDEIKMSAEPTKLDSNISCEQTKSDSNVPESCIVKEHNTNSSIDNKGWNIDDMLDGEEGLLLMTDDDLENELLAIESKPEKKDSSTAVVPPQRLVNQEEKREKAKTKEVKKQAKIRPLVRNSTVSNKKCSRVVIDRKKKEPKDLKKISRIECEPKSDSGEQEEIDLRAQLKKRREERMNKEANVDEAPRKRLIRSAFSGLVNEKTRSKCGESASRRRNRIESKVSIQSTVTIQQPVKKERPVEGGKRRVLLISNSSSSRLKTANKPKNTETKINFPKRVPESDSNSDLESYDDEAEEDDVRIRTHCEEDSEELSSEDKTSNSLSSPDDYDSDDNKLKRNKNILMRNKKKSVGTVNKLPIKLRLGFTTGRNVSISHHRDQV